MAENINKNIPKLIQSKSNNKSTVDLLRGAIASAYRHGVNVREGVLNPAVENCAFEAVINNLIIETAPHRLSTDRCRNK